MPLINTLGIIHWFWSKVAQHNLTFIWQHSFLLHFCPIPKREGWLCSDRRNPFSVCQMPQQLLWGGEKNQHREQRETSGMMEDHTPLPQPAPDPWLFITRCSLKAQGVSNTGLLTGRVSVTGQAGPCRNYTELAHALIEARSCTLVVLLAPLWILREISALLFNKTGNQLPRNGICSQT